MPKTRRTLRALTIPNLLAIEALWQDLRARRNVVGYYVGQKLTDKRRTRRLAFVVCVSRKVPTRSLRKRDRLPRHCWVPLGRGVGIQVSIDVQAVGESGRQQASAGPGDGFVPPAVNEPRATMGVALEHPTLGRVVTTAGHAVRSKPGVRVFTDATAPACRVVNMSAGSASFNGTVRKVLWTDDVDLAFVSAGPTVTNLFDDELLVTTPHIPAPSDVGSALFVLTRRGTLATVFRGVHASIDVGGFPVRNALLTDESTLAGDSGCCLVDSAFRLWGLLVGFTTMEERRFSVFQSVTPLFSTGGEGAILV